MPASSFCGCATGAPIVPSALRRCTVTLLGLLYAVSKYWPPASTLQWIGRDGSAAGAPCICNAPVAGSMVSALARCVSPATCGPPLLDTTYRQRRDGCGQTY